MTYTAREITDARIMGHSSMASFETLAAGIAWVEENFEVLCGEEFDGAYDAVIRPKGKPFMIPYQISIAAPAKCLVCKTEGFQYTCEDCWQPA